MTIANILNPPIPSLKKERLTWTDLHGSSILLAISTLAKIATRPIVIITPDSSTGTRLGYELPFFQEDGSTPLIHFPDWETLPYDLFSPHEDITSARLLALHKLPTLKKGIIIAPITTLIYRLAPREFLEGAIFQLQINDKLNIEETRLRLLKASYRCVPQVREHGEFAVRGAIIDLFPMGALLPYRIDLLDDEIDSIRTFSPETQRSIDKVNQIALLPAKEFPFDDNAIELFRQQWRSQFSGNPQNCPLYQDISEGICPPGIEYYFPFFFKKTSSFFDYLPENSLIISIGDIHHKAEEFWLEIKSRYEQHAYDITRPLLNPDQIFIPTADIFFELKNYTHVKISLEILKNKNDYDFNTQEPPQLNINYKTAKPLQLLCDFIGSYNGRILFCAETAGRREVLLQLFNSIHLHPKIYDDWQGFLADDAPYGITVAPLQEGLQLVNPPVTLIAESQLFGKRVIQRRRRTESREDIDAIVKDLTELRVGAPIVHIDHGVGRYLGLQTLKVGDYLAEFLCLEYTNEDKLYLPVTSLHLISRYTGTDPEKAPLHTLGTSQWLRAKRKAVEEVRDLAAELLDLYAKREAERGFAFKELDGQYTAFAAAFPFEETPDQLKAIEEVIHDMSKLKPMDRLVCGDVGFGKTEVAMRAAFIAIQNNKQVAVLVPTTLLSQQHYATFLDRFSDWPVQIASLSRFKTAKEQKKIIEDLENGKVDIVIGTHKLLQQKIKFKSLGLLIIDEEHRFGVQQKERLKALRFNVDILTLTATPIPRTLNMAFAGIRDLSLIATAPARRLSIKTFVHEYQKTLIQEALQREILRGGQVYFLHNDVASIEKIARELQIIVPEARISIAHGQMHERELEQIMSDFYHRRFNVLVCTTIIESGIDIPSANTIIINRADKCGLAQLHQLRGRVGRSHHQAYAYLLIPSRKTISKDAEKRLEAISTYEDLGIGFTLATHDLEIRGAGELLGKNQSGNMLEIGFTLYMDLLTRAVTALKSGKPFELKNAVLPHIEIELQIPALIPNDYLPDVQLRLQFYKRIASTKSSSELDDIQVEMIDRFGLLPVSAKNIFAIQILKQHAERLGIKKIEANNSGGKIEFDEKPNVDPLRIIKLIQTESNRYRLEGPTRLRFSLDTHEIKDRIRLISEIIERLS